MSCGAGMTDERFTLRGVIDTSRLLASVEDRPELWGEITLRQEYEGTAHADTETIFLRGPVVPPDGAPRNVLDIIDSVEYGAANVMLAGYADVLGQLSNLMKIEQLGRMMVVSLRPGGRITEHTDEGEYAQHYQRFHIAMTDSPRASLTVAGETQSFGQHELWRFNHRLPHSAVNDGDEPRIHLIFDAVVDEWWWPHDREGVDD